MGDGRKILVIGGGIFGLTAAIALRERGHAVTLVEPGPLPHPRAASTDISKLVRPDYGADDFYTEAMMTALAGWQRWNRASNERLFQRDGLLVLSSSTPRPGSFEYESEEALRRRRVAVTSIDARGLRSTFGAWRPGRFEYGYLNPTAGWVDASRVISWLAERCRSAGVDLRVGWRCEALEDRGGRVVGATVSGARGEGPPRVERFEADVTVAAAGAWTPLLVPELADRLAPVAQPVITFRPDDPTPFVAETFPPWCADVAETGWYGFPLHKSGVVKVANHGPGRVVEPDAPREVPLEDEVACRAFVADALPALADAPIAERRACLYCDSADGHFWIARHPERAGLVIAAGGSGHAFKFAPMLGAWTADVVEGRQREELRRFVWREGGSGAEAARAGR